MTRVVLLMAALSAVGLVQDRGPDAGLRTRYTKHEYRDPDARRREAVHDRLRAEGHEPQHVPHPDDAHALRRSPRTAPTTTARRSGRPQHFEKDGYIFVYQDVRGRFMSEGEFVDMRPTSPTAHGPTDVDESSDTYDTIDWLVEERAEQQRHASGMWGISYPGFYTAAGMIDAAPRAQGGRRRRRPSPTGSWATTCYHNGAFILAARTSASTRLRSATERPAADQDDRARGSTYGTPDGYEFFLDAGPAAQRRARRYFKGEVAFWNDDLPHPTYDDVLEGAQPSRRT